MRTSRVAAMAACFIPLAALAGASGGFTSGLRGHVLVPVSVNGGEARPFAVDTAASQSVLDAAAFASLAGDAPAPMAQSQHAKGAHGNFAARAVAVDSLSLWQAEQRGQVAALMTLSQLTRGVQPDFVGVLGLPFIGKYVLDLDYPARRLVLHERPLPASCDICGPEGAIAVTPLNGGLPGVQVTVNGTPMRALLDTGASRTILNARAVAALGLTGSGEAIARASIALGPGSPRAHEVAHFDLPVFRTLGLDDEPALILGIDYLSAGRLVLDLAAGQAWFVPAGG